MSKEKENLVRMLGYKEMAQTIAVMSLGVILAVSIEKLIELLLELNT